jgi:pyridine nucleotide-disulfide oxidoreductase family protein
MKRLLLVGAGHAHAQVLLSLAGRPLARTEVTVVSPHALAPYSGMVPGWLAGHYRFDEICIHFASLSAAAGARWVVGELSTLDPDRRQATLASGETLAYDVLSLNNGATLTPPTHARGEMLSMRPLAELHQRWEALLQRWQAASTDAPFTVTAIGGGAAGFESLLAVLARLRALAPQRTVHGGLVTRSATLLPGFAPGAVRAGERALARAGVSLQRSSDWSEAVAARSDLVLWATGAEAQAWQQDAARRGTLAVSPRGFVRVGARLASLSHANVFAAGDCAEWADPLPKAGVYAVRMGPVLTRNLRAALGDGAAVPYVPQRRFLALLASADGRAIASRGGLSAEGRWVWHWKDHIDRSFVRRLAAPDEALHRSG